MGVFAVPSGSDVDPNADKRSALYATSGVFMFVTLLAVTLRFVSRKLGKIQLKMDDWLILVAVPFCFVTNGVNIYGPKNNGEGRHINYSTPESLKRFFQATYVFLICYNIAIALAKYSLIYFYRRIFSTENFRKPLLITAILTTGWLIGCTFATVFSCSPVQGYWEVDKPSKCINERAFYTGQTASNMLLDVILLILPIFAISRLHMSRAHKVGVVGIFALGIFVTVCSAVRLAELIKIQSEEEFDFTFDIVEAACWSVIEVNVSLVCACLPTLRPLLRLVLSGSPHPRSSSRSRPPLSSRAASGPFSPLESGRGGGVVGGNGRGLEGGYKARVFVGDEAEAREQYEMGKRDRGEGSGGEEDIKVETEVTWFESRRESSGAAETESMEALRKDVEAGR